MQLRAGTVADAEAIAALIASFHREVTTHPDGAGAEHYFASVSTESERGYLASERYLYLVAEDGPNFLGFIAMRDISHVFHLFVARQHHRRGIAKRLWQEARARAVEAGNPARFTVNSSLGAVPTYRSFGFEPTGEVASIHGISYRPMQLMGGAS